MADQFLILTQQLAAEIEGTPGTAEVLAAADVLLKPFQGDNIYNPDYPRFDNDEVAEDIGEAADFVSGAKGGIAVGVVAKTSGVVGTAPALGKYLRGCGLKEQAVKTITIGAIAGGDSAFAAGETYSDGGSKTGIIEQASSGTGLLRYIVTAGGDLSAADVVTVAGDGDSATASGSSAEYATKYTPRSTGQETLTIQRAEKNSEGTSSQDFLYRIKGAMGSGILSFAPLDAPRFNAEYSGVEDLAAAGAFFSGYTYEAGDPPKYINAACQLNSVPVEPGDISLDLGNQVELDPDGTTTGGTAGFLRARVAKREPTITIAPRKLIAGTLNVLALMKAGTPVPFSLIIGTTPDVIEISAANCQIRSVSPGERGGVRTEELTLHITRATLTDEDFCIYFR